MQSWAQVCAPGAGDNPMSQLADQTGLGNRQKVFGPNRANVRLLLYAALVFVLVGLVLVGIGLGKKYPRDKAGFVGGGVAMLFIAGGLFVGSRMQLKVQVEVCDQGFAARDWLGRRRTCRWDDVDTVYEFIGYYRATYRPNQWVYTVRAKDGHRIKLGMTIDNVRGLGHTVLYEVGKRRLPQALKTYRAGGLVDLGQISLSVQGLVSGQQLLPWDQVEKIRFGRMGDVSIYQKDKRVPWKTLLHPHIANYPVFRAVIHQVAIPPQTQAIIEDPTFVPSQPVAQPRALETTLSQKGEGRV